MRLDIASQTDKGRRKAKNEDACGVYYADTPGNRLLTEGALLCVCDGLGGHMGGEIASKLAVSHIKDMLKHELPPQDEMGDMDERDVGPFPILRAAMLHANDSIFQQNRDILAHLGDPNARPMGTTVLAAVVESRKVYIGNVGDSRAYHLRGAEIIARTEDHSWVDEQVKLGLMSKAEAETDRRKNILTRSVGTHQDISVDTYKWHIAPGDMILLCSDGLVNMVPDADIERIFQTYGTSAEIAHHLVQLANENGGKDNITVIVAHINPSPWRMLMQRVKSTFRKHGFNMMWIAMLIGALVGGFFIGAFAQKRFELL